MSHTCLSARMPAGASVCISGVSRRNETPRSQREIERDGGRERERERERDRARERERETPKTTKPDQQRKSERERGAQNPKVWAKTATALL